MPPCGGIFHFQETLGGKLVQEAIELLVKSR